MVIGFLKGAGKGLQREFGAISQREFGFYSASKGEPLEALNWEVLKCFYNKHFITLRPKVEIELRGH